MVQIHQSKPERLQGERITDGRLEGEEIGGDAEEDFDVQQTTQPARRIVINFVLVAGHELHAASCREKFSVCHGFVCTVVVWSYLYMVLWLSAALPHRLLPPVLCSFLVSFAEQPRDRTCVASEYG